MTVRDLLKASWWGGFLFWVERGETHWCGRYVILHYPRHLSQAFGRGTSGLWVFRWTERGHAAIRYSRQWTKKQKSEAKRVR